MVVHIVIAFDKIVLKHVGSGEIWSIFFLIQASWVEKYLNSSILYSDSAFWVVLTFKQLPPVWTKFYE